MTATATATSASPFGTDAVRKPQPFCSGTGQAPAVLVPGRGKHDGSPCSVCGAVLVATKAGKMPRHQAVVMPAEESPALGNDVTPVEAVPAPAPKRTRKPKAVPAALAEEPTEAAEEAPKGPAYRAPIVKAGAGTEATFRKVRANGTTRAIPTYPVGTKHRDTADAMFAAREQGATVATIAESFHVSVPTVRRMLQSLALTVQQERAAAAAVKAASTRKAKAGK